MKNPSENKSNGNVNCSIGTLTKTKSKVIHKNVSQGYYKVKLHIIKIFIFAILAFI